MTVLAVLTQTGDNQQSRNSFRNELSLEHFSQCRISPVGWEADGGTIMSASYSKVLIADDSVLFTS